MKAKLFASITVLVFVILLIPLSMVSYAAPSSPAMAQEPEPAAGLTPTPHTTAPDGADQPVEQVGLSPAVDTDRVPAVMGSSPATSASGSYRIYMPLIRGGAGPSTPEWLRRVNQYRQLAGVPAVTDDRTLSANCWEHARYMAENNHITHHQDAGLPWVSAAGEICANKGNAWMGGAFSRPYWTLQRSIDGWMGSVGHRLWLLYPTTPAFGYGFYTAANNRAAAGLDVLSRAALGGDTNYRGWPIRYPAPNQTGIPAKKYPITLNWRYFGPAPTLDSVTLTTASGVPIAHRADTALSVRHKGVQILPTDDLPPNTTIVVRVSGSYEGTPFTYTWSFTTSSA